MADTLGQRARAYAHQDYARSATLLEAAAKQGDALLQRPSQPSTCFMISCTKLFMKPMPILSLISF